MKERFLKIYNDYISRQGSEALLAWLESSDYFKAPASTKYHGNYEQGLLEHSLNVYDVLKERISNDPQMWNNNGSCKVTEETIAICALLHDVCKVNFYKKGLRNVKEDNVWVTKEIYEIDEKFPCGDHSDKSIIILQNFMHLEPEEILAIRAHMGGFDAAAKGGSFVVSKIFEQSRLAVHLHLADMEATYLKEAING